MFFVGVFMIALNFPTVKTNLLVCVEKKRGNAAWFYAIAPMQKPPRISLCAGGFVLLTLILSGHVVLAILYYASGDCPICK